MSTRRIPAHLAVVMTAVAVMGVPFAACSRADKKAPARSAAATQPAAGIGDTAPPFTLLGPDGKPVSLSDFKGKIVVLEATNPECPHTRRHFDANTQANLARKYAAKGVVWLGVDSTPTHTPAQQEAFIKLHELPYPILSDPAGKVGRAYGMRSTPDVRIVGTDGKIAYMGGMDDDPRGDKKEVTNYVAAALDDLLAGRRVAKAKTRPYGCQIQYAPPTPDAPTFTLKDQDGKPVSLSDFKGKIVVIEWINPDCPYSRRHTDRATLKKLAEEYGDKGVAFLAINSTHYFTVEKNKAWHDKHAYNHPILDDRSGKVGRAFGAKTTPDIRILDAKGAVAYSGAIDDDRSGKAKEPTVYVAKALAELLAGKKVSTPLTKPYGCSVKYAR